MRTMKRTAALCLLLVAPVLWWIGCNDDSVTNPAPAGNGTLELRLTDSPTAYDSVLIVVDSVTVHVSSSDSAAGWYTLNRTRAVYDLLRLSNGIDTLLATGQIPAGVYSQIRLFIGDGSRIVVDGWPYPLETPSGSRSGVKLNVHASIQPGVVYVLVLDFDVQRSIVRTGNDRFLLKPVIRTVARAITGAIAGTVAPASANATVTAFSATDTASATAGTNGAFRVAFLPAGTYTLLAVPQNPALYDTAVVQGVAVSVGQVTNVGTITLPPP